MKKRAGKKSYFVTILFVAFLMNFGCSEDFFNEKAGDRIKPEQHYQSQVDALVSLYGAIIPLQDIMPKYIMLDGLRSDMMDVTESADAYLNEINSHTVSAGNPFTDAADYYKVIVNINETLANIDRVAEVDKDYDDFIAHFVRGALIGMRSWTYFHLVRIYGQAAYIDDNLTTLPENLEQNFLSKEVMIDTLINQLIPYIHENYPSETEFAEVKINHYVNTKALLGELYLEKNDYATAVDYLKLACESYLNQSALLKVDGTYKDAAWGAIFLNAEDQGIENLSVIPYSSVEDQSNPLADWMWYQYTVKPTQVLIDSYNSQIAADGTIGDLYRGLYTLWEDTLSGHHVITKYFLDSNDPFSSDIIISRAADIHLLLAEAYNRLGDEESQEYALMLLNQGVNSTNPKPTIFARWSRNVGIRGRAYLESKEVPNNVKGNKRILYIEDLIIAERALELAYEGKRWFDLVRIAERRNEPEYLADKVAEKFRGTGRYNEIHSRLMDPLNWYLPVE